MHVVEPQVVLFRQVTLPGQACVGPWTQTPAPSQTLCEIVFPEQVVAQVVPAGAESKPQTPALQVGRWQTSPWGQSAADEHPAWQLPLMQVVPGGQTFPQAPQLFGSERTDVSHPLAGLPSQSA